MSSVHQHEKCGHRGCETQHSFFKNEKFLKVMVILEKISLCALAIFAAYISPKLFFPFMGGGIVLGAYLYWDTHTEQDPEGIEDTGGCSQGFLEQLTGVKLPPPIGLGANLAITACHLEHHAAVFAPLIGLNFGMWVGKFLGESLPFYYRQFTAIPTPVGPEMV